jgi:hypothetical protein
VGLSVGIGGGLSHDKGEPSKKQCWLTEPFEASNVFAGRQLSGASPFIFLRRPWFFPFSSFSPRSLEDMTDLRAR